jgi:predicted nucleotidyltransferase
MALSKGDIIEKIEKNIHEVDSTAEIWLFGSRARNDEHLESDWDVLVLSKKQYYTF